MAITLLAAATTQALWAPVAEQLMTTHLPGLSPVAAAVADAVVIVGAVAVDVVLPGVGSDRRKKKKTTEGLIKGLLCGSR